MPAKSDRVTITKAVIAEMEPGARAWDSELPGFGVEKSRAGSGAASFVLKARINGQQKWITIGRFAAPWTVDSARKEARRLLGQAVAGVDEKAEKKRQLEVQRLEAEAAAAAETAATTFRQLFDEFWTMVASRQAGAKAMKAAFDRWLMPSLADRPAASISRAEFSDEFARIANSGAPVLANRLLSKTKRMYNWAIDTGKAGVVANPINRMPQPTEEESRERVLSDAEIGEVWRAAVRLGWPFGPWCRLLMLTAARLTEGAKAMTPHFDRANREWVMPGKAVKNRHGHKVPYPIQVDEILDSAVIFPECDYLFSTTGRTPISGLSKAKEQLDRLIVSERATIAKAAGKKPKPLEPWTFHDFRRTIVTHCAANGVPEEVADKLLNHVGGKIQGVKKVYNKHEYLKERRAALAMWADHVERCAAASPQP